MANPTLLKTPIASGGDKNTIPETTGSTTGLLSQEKGWQQINSLPINAGGIAPSRLDFNGVFNLLSNILFYAQKGWVWEFDETQSYYAGCTVKDTADGKTYVCIADVNASTTHPSSDTMHWKLSDLATKDDLANYLPLAGGSMTGGEIKRSVNNAYLQLVGAQDETKGAYINLFGKDHSNAGRFQMGITNNVGYANLVGNATGDNAGTLTWCGHNVLTDSNGGYLPLSGGTMTGMIHRSRSYPYYMRIFGGPEGERCADIQIMGSEFDDTNKNSGRIVLEALSEKDTDVTQFYVRRNGSITAQIPAYNSPIDIAGSAIVAKSIGTTGYIKYASGLVMQWGTATNLPASQDVVPVTFPITFPNGVGSVVITSAGDYGNQRGFSWGQVKDVTTTGFKFSTAATDVDSQGKNWFAIGY